MVRYHLDAAKLKKTVIDRGYSHVSEFAGMHGFNRATLSNYLNGRGGPFSEVYYAICEALQVDPVAMLSPVVSKLSLDTTEIMPVVKGLCAFDNEIAVGLLGSRAKETHRKYSDWDLCVTRGKRPLRGEEFLKLKRSVEEDIDNLPREVDIVNLEVAPDWFLEEINYDPVFLAGNSNSWSYFMGVLCGAKKRKQA